MALGVMIFLVGPNYLIAWLTCVMLPCRFTQDHSRSHNMEFPLLALWREGHTRASNVFYNGLSR